MIPSLLLLAMTQGDVRPNTLPPMAELKDETSFLGSIAGISFSPDYGGLPIIHDRHWSVSRSRAGDNGLIVNLRTGELSYVTAPDYMDRQVLCPDAMFVRSYRSELAKLGKRSPGLPYGWVHNYDLIIKLPSGAEKWEPVTLTYPNKSQELIEPQFNEKGEATGWGKSLSNATYDVGMVPGAAINTYKSISIRWPRTQVTWTFEPHESGVMVLSSVDHGRDIQGHLGLSYLPDRKLASVFWLEKGIKFLKFNYVNDYLATMVTREDEYTIGYTYTTVGGKVVLWKVTDPFKAQEKPHDSLIYSYASDLDYPALAQIATPDGNSWAKSTVEYRKDGSISAVQGASGNRQEVGPRGG